MAFTQQDLDAVNTAIASGALTVKMGGREVTYRSLDELLKARATITSEIAAAQPGGRARTGYFTFATSRERF